MKILVADDSDAMRSLLQLHLEEWGHEVVLVENGERAWEHFRDHGCDIVISDWMMPGLDGVELVRRIRAFDRPGYVYAILLTARGRTEDIVAGMEAGADDFVVKPFDENVLRARIRAGERIVRLEHHLTEANQRMHHDLEVAAEVQRTFLPVEPPRIEGLRFAWAFEPCEELAGDMLSCFRLDEHHAGLYLLDVSGHGVCSALHSVTLSRLLAPTPVELSLLREPDGAGGLRPIAPARVARSLNDRFLSNDRTADFVTLVYGVLDLRTRELRYVSAGHPAPALIGPGVRARLLEESPPCIGFIEGASFREHAVTLAPGDRIYLYSDGIIEARDASRSQFGAERLLGALAESVNVPLDRSIRDLIDRVRGWTDGGRLADDVSVLAMEVPASSPEVVASGP